jgi:hypothetical protein
MRRARLVLAFAFACLAGPTLAASGALPCAATDTECAKRLIRAHPLKTLAFWKDSLARPLQERAAAGEPEVVEFLVLDTIAQSIPSRPSMASPAPDLLDDVRAAIAELPPAVQRLLDRKLAGIRLVNDIGGTGFTDTVQDGRGEEVAAFVVLDPSVLARRRANEWATWKESSPFRDDGVHRLEAVIEDAARDDRMHAIQYILLHEFGHVLSVGERFHPSWTVSIAQVGSTAEFAFFDLSWTVARAQRRYATRYDAEFPERPSVVYYFGAKLDGAQMESTYDHLERTNFPTLYAVTHPGDDFAESFASYVHTIRMGRPFEIRLLRDGKPVKVYKSCWGEERCAAKRAILDAMLDGSK